MGPIYEVNFFVDRDIADEFGLWLDDHIRDALRVDGVLECNCFVRTDDERGLARRSCQYVLADDGARITSYNVCYTKLLRANIVDGAHAAKMFGNIPGGDEAGHSLSPVFFFSSSRVAASSPRRSMVASTSGHSVSMNR